jgi:hypothetical protein
MEHGIVQYVVPPSSEATSPSLAMLLVESTSRAKRYKNLPKTGVAVRFFCIPVADFK